MNKTNYKIYQRRNLSKTFSNRKAKMLYLFDKTSSIFIKSRKFEIKSPKKILLIRNDHIGDVVLDTGIFREVKKKFPESEITAIIPPETEELVEKNKNVDRIIPLGLFWRKKSFSSFVEYLKVLRKLRKERYDLGIDIRASLMNILFLLWLPKVRKRAGYWNVSGGKAFLNSPVEFEKKEHTIKFDMKLAEKALNFKAKDYFPEIITDREDEKRVADFLKKNNLKSYICICPGASYKEKMWSIEKQDALIKWFIKRYPKYKILLVGGSSDEKIIKKLGENKNCIPLINFNLRLLSILFRKSKFVIANDGGPMHIAWVSGAKLLALWGPIDLETMKPLKNSIVLHHKLECSPCLSCTKKTGERCIDLISVEEVKRAVEKILASTKIQSSR